MTDIRKKYWPGLFDKVLKGEKNVDVRLADFDIRKGDTLILEEYDPEAGSYTGRSVRKKVNNLNRVQLLDFHSEQEIRKHGHWIIELGD